MLGNFEDIQKLSKNNMDAMTKSFGALPKTIQAIATEMTDYSKRSFENGSKAIEKLLAVRSLDKAIEVQSEYATTVCKDYTTQMTKLNELYAGFTKELLEPFNGQVAKTPAGK